jgi:hypothetical protein
MPDPVIPSRLTLSENARAALGKLPTAEAVHVMEDMLNKVAGVNNSNNNSRDLPELSREELLAKVNSVPDAELKKILQAHGII